MLDTLGHKHTPRICNTSRFPTATMLQERASVLHYAHVGFLVVFYEPLSPVCEELVQHCGAPS